MGNDWGFGMGGGERQTKQIADYSSVTLEFIAACFPEQLKLLSHSFLFFYQSGLSRYLFKFQTPRINKVKIYLEF